MGIFRKEWTDEEIKQLEYDLKQAKFEVLYKHNFTIEEIGRIMELPESVIRILLMKSSKKESE